VKGDVFLCEVEQRSGQGGVVFDKMVVEVTKAQEFLDVLHGLRRWPVGNSHKFDWIHMEFSFGDDQTQIFHGCLVKGTFLGSEIKIKV